MGDSKRGLKVTAVGELLFPIDFAGDEGGFAFVVATPNSRLMQYLHPGR